jgi:hypothetical protein
MDAGKPVPDGIDHRTQIVRAPVGEFLAADVSPDALDRVEVGRVGGQADNRQTSPVIIQVAHHQTAAMRRQAVPDEYHASASQLTPQMGKAVYQLGLVVAVRHDAEVQASAFAVPTICQDRADGELLPVERVGKYRRAPPRRPCPANGRTLRNGAFIEENYPRAPGFRFFLRPPRFQPSIVRPSAHHVPGP